jgi:hypothetical protein
MMRGLIQYKGSNISLHRGPRNKNFQIIFL